jgi:hypothetical protein
VVLLTRFDLTHCNKLVVPTNDPVFDLPIKSKLDVATLFYLGLIHLQHNQTGFARTFWQQAVKAKVRSWLIISRRRNILKKAKQCLAILEDYHLPIHARIETILRLYY